MNAITDLQESTDRRPAPSTEDHFFSLYGVLVWESVSENLLPARARELLTTPKGANISRGCTHWERSMPARVFSRFSVPPSAAKSG